MRSGKAEQRRHYGVCTSPLPASVRLDMRCNRCVRRTLARRRCAAESVQIDPLARRAGRTVIRINDERFRSSASSTPEYRALKSCRQRSADALSGHDHGTWWKSLIGLASRICQKSICLAAFSANCGAVPLARLYKLVPACEVGNYDHINTNHLSFFPIFVSRVLHQRR